MRSLRVPLRLFSTRTTRPWYVSESTAQQQQPTKFDLPAAAPARLEPLCVKLADDLGLKDLHIIDAREKPNNPGIMVVGTGLSSRHLGRATQQLRSWLKTDGVKTQIEGTLSSNFIRTWRRRTKRRQERQRSYAPAIDIDPTLQQKTGDWIVVDTNENIYVHLMTEDKRRMLDLESLVEEFEEEEPKEPLWKGYADPKPSGATGASTTGGRRQYSTAATTPLENIVTPVINGEPLDALIDWVRGQLIEGQQFSASDIHALLAAVTYHKFADFEKMRVTPESTQQFSAVCDAKAKAVLELCNLITRPRGQLLLSDQALAVLWRAFVAPSSQSITPSDALKDPTPGSRPQGFADPRFTTLLSLIESNRLYLQPQILLPLCAALINTGYWKTMWRLLNRACVVVDMPSIYIDAIIAMIVKSGNEIQIQSLLNVFLPALYRDKFVPSEELERTIEIAEKVLSKTKGLLD